MINKDDIKKPNISENVNTESSILGANMNFATAEAFKLLRTNISFSLPDEAKCRIIGVTSSIPGEGKTFTSINLAWSIAQTDKRVLLIEGDMRLPTISKRTGLLPTPGLSNLLVGLEQKIKVVQNYTSKLSILVAGDIPPNPSELLTSKRMHSLIETISEKYDYIIIDLPPVTSVSDALIVSKYVSGMLVVSRQDYCYKASFNDTIRQLEQVNAKILGVVFNASSDSSGGKYGKKYKKYGRHYVKYYKEYQRSYEDE